jgi:hypothetical protein
MTERVVARKTKTKTLVVNLKGLGAKMNWLAVNSQSLSNSVTVFKGLTAVQCTGYTHTRIALRLCLSFYKYLPGTVSFTNEMELPCRRFFMAGVRGFLSGHHELFLAPSWRLHSDVTGNDSFYCIAVSLCLMFPFVGWTNRTGLKIRRWQKWDDQLPMVFFVQSLAFKRATSEKCPCSLSVSRRGQDYSRLHKSPDQLWGTPSLLCNWYRRLFPREWSLPPTSI